MIKHSVCFILLLLTVLFTHAQTPLNFTYSEEMEDSVSALAIKPVKKPKKLLKSIVHKLLLDLEEKAEVSRYQVEIDFNLNTSTPCRARCIISGEAGIRIKKTGEMEDFRYNGPFNLTRQDSSLICLSLMLDSDVNNSILSHIDDISLSEGISKHQALKKLMRAHNVMAYSISDDSGRGVYRINFAPKKKKITEYNQMLLMFTFTGTAYFDSNTLHLTQVKAISTQNIENQNVVNTAIRLRPSSATSSSYRNSYQIDYNETGGSPIVEKIRSVILVDNTIVSRTTVQRVP